MREGYDDDNRPGERPATIRIQDVKKIYRMDGVEVSALKGVSLDIEQGEFVSIMGTSGSGKSTLMHITGCLDRPSEGTIYLDGIDVSELHDNSLADIRNKKIGFIFQSFNLLARTSALTNVELPLLYAGVPRSERKKRAREALERVGLGMRLDHFPSQLSGGEQQRVAIARALINHPSLVLADEPTGNLDSSSGAEVMRMLGELHEQGITLIMVTHDRQVAEHADRIIHIKDGLIVGDERVDRKAVVEQQDMMESPPALEISSEPGTDEGCGEKSEPVPEAIAAPAGETAEEAAAAEDVPAKKPAPAKKAVSAGKAAPAKKSAPAKKAASAAGSGKEKGAGETATGKGMVEAGQAGKGEAGGESGEA
jgi:putative ABC transport system ATP-binding protein